MFGYQQLTANGLNSYSQIRQSTDMAYQRGATFEVVVTGHTYNTSLKLDVDLWVKSELVGRMSLSPYETSTLSGVHYYRFGIRPYEYLSNLLRPEHYTTYYKNNWYETEQLINFDKRLNNILRFQMKYGWRYLVGGQTVTEYTVRPENLYTHFSDILMNSSIGAEDFHETGSDFDLVGGSFQMQEKLILANMDQQVGTNPQIYLPNTERNYSPMSQFLMNHPQTPEESETGRFLTEAPRTQTIGLDENYCLYYLAGKPADRHRIEVDLISFRFYTRDGQRFEKVIQIQPLADELGIFTLPCGVADIKQLFGTDNVIYSGQAQSVEYTWADIKEYRVQLFSGWNNYSTNELVTQVLMPIGYANIDVNPLSEVFYFKIDDRCTNERVRLVWLNSRGGYDYYTFTAKRVDKLDVERKSYDNRHFGPSTAQDHSVGRTLRTFDTEVLHEIIVETDFITAAEGRWLEELYYSPQVYEMRPDYISPIDAQNKYYKDLRPLQVDSTQVERVNHKYKKLWKYRLTLKSAQPFFTVKAF